MTVATMPPPFSVPSDAQSSAITAISWSPSMTMPFSSTMSTRSASPSSAMPISARTSCTFFASASGWVEPQSRLMLMPFGSLPMVTTSAPSSQSASGGNLVGGAIGAVDRNAQTLQGHVTRQGALGKFDIAVMYAVDALGTADLVRLGQLRCRCPCRAAPRSGSPISSDSL